MALERLDVQREAIEIRCAQSTGWDFRRVADADELATRDRLGLQHPAGARMSRRGDRGELNLVQNAGVHKRVGVAAEQHAPRTDRVPPRVKRPQIRLGRGWTRVPDADGVKHFVDEDFMLRPAHLDAAGARTVTITGLALLPVTCILSFACSNSPSERLRLSSAIVSKQSAA